MTAIFAAFAPFVTRQGLTFAAVYTHQDGTKNVVATESRWPMKLAGRLVVVHRGRCFEPVVGRSGHALFIDLNKPLGYYRPLKSSGQIVPCSYKDFGLQTKAQRQSQAKPAPAPAPAMAAFVEPPKADKKTMSEAKARGLYKAQITKAEKAHARGDEAGAAKARKAAETIFARYLSASPKTEAAPAPVEQAPAIEDILAKLPAEKLVELLTKALAAHA